MSIRVLVLDRHSAYRRSVQDGLGDYPNEVNVVGATMECDAAIADATLQPQVILLSDRFPFSVISTLRNQYPACAIVLSTSFFDPHHVHEGIHQWHTKGYVLRQCCGDDLIQAIKVFHSGEALPQANIARFTHDPPLWGSMNHATTLPGCGKY